MKEMDDLNQKFQDLVQTIREHHDDPMAKTFVIAAEDRQHLERLLGRNLNDVSELVRAVEQALTLNVADVPVPLPPNLVERLKSRSFSMPFDKFINMLVRRALEQYVGLR